MKLSESAEAKLSRYQFVIADRDAKIKEDDSNKHEITHLYAPPINMLACDFANQVIEDKEGQK